MKLLSPQSWNEYELIDSGEGEKLERFGRYILIRPEPQAIWKRVLAIDDWKKVAHAHFTREQKDKFRFSEEKGGWNKLKTMPDDWEIVYEHSTMKMVLKLALTNFGHVGIFPEQGENWNFIYDTLQSWSQQSPNVLNLFAYTGAASLSAALGGAVVTHVDASRPGLNWANHNMKINRLDHIRWVFEDALKFAKREVKRGNQYQGIIMDPPPYGRGPSGEKWTLHEKLDELVFLASQLLVPDRHFFILSTYAAGLSSVVCHNIVKSYFKEKKVEWGEFFLKSSHHNDLPMGTFLRFKN